MEQRAHYNSTWAAAIRAAAKSRTLSHAIILAGSGETAAAARFAASFARIAALFAVWAAFFVFCPVLRTSFA